MQLCAALWVGLCWVHMRFAIYFAWVPMGSSVFTMGSCRVILGSAAACRYLQWVPLGFLLGFCIFATNLNGVLLGSWWVPRLCVAICSGFLLGSCWVPRLCVAICSGFLLGSCWVPAFSQHILMGSSWVPVGFCGFASRQVRLNFFSEILDPQPPQWKWQACVFNCFWVSNHGQCFHLLLLFFFVLKM